MYRDPTFARTEAPIPDLYADGFNVKTTPLGMALTLVASPPIDEGGAKMPSKALASFRMTYESAKLLAWLLRKAIIEAELKHGVVFEVAASVLNDAQIPREDWDGFWPVRRNGMQR